MNTYRVIAKNTRLVIDFPGTSIFCRSDSKTAG
jgi:hypothetical protein